MLQSHEQDAVPDERGREREACPSAAEPSVPHAKDPSEESPPSANGAEAPANVRCQHVDSSTAGRVRRFAGDQLLRLVGTLTPFPPVGPGRLNQSPPAGPSVSPAWNVINILSAGSTEFSCQPSVGRIGGGGVTAEEVSRFLTSLSITDIVKKQRGSSEVQSQQTPHRMLLHSHMDWEFVRVLSDKPRRAGDDDVTAHRTRVTALHRTIRVALRDIIVV